MDMRELLLDNLAGTLIKFNNEEDLKRYLNTNKEIQYNYLMGNYVLSILKVIKKDCGYINFLKDLAKKSIKIDKLLEELPKNKQHENEILLDIFDTVKEMYLNINNEILHDKTEEEQLLNQLHSGLGNMVEKIKESLDIVYEAVKVDYDLLSTKATYTNGDTIEGIIKIKTKDNSFKYTAFKITTYRDTLKCISM